MAVYRWNFAYKTLFWDLFGYGDETDVADVVVKSTNISTVVGNETVHVLDVQKHKVRYSYTKVPV